MDIASTVKLNNGVKMPCLALGVWETPRGREGIKVIEHALRVGYRHIDTASMYGNEKEVGEAVRNSGIPRDEVFVTTKVWNDEQGYKGTLAACERSLRRLDIGHIDLYLVHWPVPEHRRETWRAMEELYGKGIVRAIGVSNYTVRHVDEMEGYASIRPVANQVEFNPWLFQKELLDHCMSRAIVIEAYCPLTRGKRLKDRTLNEVAANYSKTPAQILIRWGLQHGVVELPKSQDTVRIEQNADIFDFVLNEKDMAALDSLDEGDHITWDPTDEP